VRSISFRPDFFLKVTELERSIGQLTKYYEPTSYEGESKSKGKFLNYAVTGTMPVEEFSHVQYSALSSVEWQQRGRKHGRSFARLHHRRITWRSAVSLGRRSETCGNSPSYVGSVWTEHHESTQRFMSGWKGLNRVEHVLLMKVVLVGHQHRTHKTTRAAEKLLLRRTTETKLRGFSPRANHTDRAAAAGRRS